jgi:hypothetical protein
VIFAPHRDSFDLVESGGLPCTPCPEHCTAGFARIPTDPLTISLWLRDQSYRIGAPGVPGLQLVRAAGCPSCRAAPSRVLSGLAAVPPLSSAPHPEGRAGEGRAPGSRGR